jgi:hypothetical protein
MTKLKQPKEIVKQELIEAVTNIENVKQLKRLAFMLIECILKQSMFDARTILRKKLKNIDNIFCVYNPIAKDDYLYIWKGDRVFLLTTKSKMKTLIY